MHPAIEGLQYVPNYLDAATHDALIASVDRHPWLQSADRGVQIYGYRYHHPTQSMCQIGDLPPWAAGLAARLCRDGFVSSTPNQVVVNDYRPGAGILAHVDQAAWRHRGIGQSWLELRDEVLQDEDRAPARDPVGTAKSAGPFR